MYSIHKKHYYISKQLKDKIYTIASKYNCCVDFVGFANGGKYDYLVSAEHYDELGKFRKEFDILELKDFWGEKID